MKPEKRTFTRKELSRKSMRELFEIYIKWINDEMSPIMWRGLGKKDALEAILGGKNEIESVFEN